MNNPTIYRGYEISAYGSNFKFIRQSDDEDNGVMFLCTLDEVKNCIDERIEERPDTFWVQAGSQNTALCPIKGLFEALDFCKKYNGFMHTQFLNP